MSIVEHTLFDYGLLAEQAARQLRQIEFQLEEKEAELSRLHGLTLEVMWEEGALYHRASTLIGQNFKPWFLARYGQKQALLRQAYRCINVYQATEGNRDNLSRLLKAGKTNLYALGTKPNAAARKEIITMLQSGDDISGDDIVYAIHKHKLADNSLMLPGFSPNAQLPAPAPNEGDREVIEGQFREALKPRLLILGCSQSKRNKAGHLPAFERYNGPVYQMIRKLKAEKEWPDDVDVFILSAKYGLIPMEHPIEYYDLKLEEAGITELGKRIQETLLHKALLGEREAVFVSMGINYEVALKLQKRRVYYADGAPGQRVAQTKAWLLGETIMVWVDRKEDCTTHTVCSGCATHIHYKPDGLTWLTCPTCRQQVGVNHTTPDPESTPKPNTETTPTTEPNLPSKPPAGEWLDRDPSPPPILPEPESEPSLPPAPKTKPKKEASTPPLLPPKPAEPAKPPSLPASNVALNPVSDIVALLVDDIVDLDPPERYQLADELFNYLTVAQIKQLFIEWQTRLPEKMEAESDESLLNESPGPIGPCCAR